MGGESPNVVLYDMNGNVMPVQNGSAIPASTPALLIAGSDGTNSRYLTVDTSGRLVVVGAGTAGTATGGVLTIQGVSGGTVVPISGTVTANAGTGNFAVVQATAANLNATVVASGNFNNASVSATAAAPPASATYIGGSVTTASPTYTTGQMDPLSLTTAGALRIDGSAVTQPVSGTVTANAGTGTFSVSGTVTANQGTANTLANAWSTKITDATNGPAAVKPASTAAVATDPALVVAISPNNVLSLSTQDVTATGALGALNAAVAVTHPGLASVGFQLAAGTLIGTIIPEVSFDGGTTWNATFFDNPTTDNKVASIVFGSANTATAMTIVGVGGVGQTRVRVSAYTSGTANITVRASDINDPSLLSGGQAGAALPPAILQTGGSVTTAAPTYTTATLNALSLTTTGLLRIDGVYPLATATPTTDVTFVGGAVTTAAPTYTTGQLDPLSLDITGNLRVLANQPTAANLNATVVASGNFNNASVGATAAAPPADATYMGGSVTTASPTYTTGQMDPLSLTTGGLLRIDGVYPINATTPTTDITFVGAAVTTAAPAYTTGQLSALSLTTAGLLRVDGVYPLAATTPTTDVTFVGGAVTTAAPTYTTGQLDPLSLDTLGNLRVLATQAPVVGAALADAWSMKITDATNGPAAVKPASTAAVATDPALVVAISPNNIVPIIETDQLSSGSYPDPASYISGTDSPTIDAFGNLEIRGPIITDEGSLRDDFTGSALTTALTGTVTFTNGSLAVTGSGTSFTTQIAVGQYIKKTADSETDYVQVSSIQSNTALTLVSTYPGTTGGAASVVSNWQTVTPSGGSFAVASSVLTLACGTTASATGSIRSLGDYLPYSIEFYAEVSQRIANQTIYMGLENIVGTPAQQAIVQFTGTTNTQVNFVTSFAATTADTQTTTVTLPNGATTATYHQYKIDLSQNQATLSIDGYIVAINTTHLPSPYTIMYVTAGVINGGTAPASNTNLLIDYIFFENIDRIQIDQDFPGEALPIQGSSPSGSSVSFTNPVLVGGIYNSANVVTVAVDSQGRIITSPASALASEAGFANGFAALTVATKSFVGATAYNEQTTAVQRSFSSTSANDANAGTGAQQVTFTYFDASGNGPYTETDTLNGTTAVNTTATNICFIESIAVSRVGSGASNAGTITMWTATAGGGTAIGTITIGANQTFWCHHYVPVGYTCYVTGIVAGANNNAGASFTATQRPIGVTGAVEVQISDFVRNGGGGNASQPSFERSYGTPLNVTGPARINGYVTPDQATTSTYWLSFDYYQQA